MRRLKTNAETSPLMIIFGVVIIGLLIFFGARYYINKNKEPLVVNPIEENTTSTSTVYVEKFNGTLTGGVNLTDGMDLTIQNPVEPVEEGKSLVKVIYPNRTLTPGIILPFDAEEICTEGYQENIGEISQSTKDEVFRRYLLSPNQPDGAFQIDALIPLSLGGGKDVRNLWPQPAEPKPGYHEKDQLEEYYYNQVCEGKMSLNEAQSNLITNWFQGYVDAYTEGGF